MTYQKVQLVRWDPVVQVVLVVQRVLMVLVVQRDQADQGFLSLQGHQVVHWVPGVLVVQLGLWVQQVPEKVATFGYYLKKDFGISFNELN